MSAFAVETDKRMLKAGTPRVCWMRANYREWIEDYNFIQAGPSAAPYARTRTSKPQTRGQINIPSCSTSTRGPKRSSRKADPARALARSAASRTRRSGTTSRPIQPLKRSSSRRTRRDTAEQLCSTTSRFEFSHAVASPSTAAGFRCDLDHQRRHQCCRQVAIEVDVVLLETGTRSSAPSR